MSLETSKKRNARSRKARSFQSHLTDAAVGMSIIRVAPRVAKKQNSQRTQDDKMWEKCSNAFDTGEPGDYKGKVNSD